MEMKGLKLALLMAMVQIGYASASAMYKLAVNDGMSITVVTAYRLMFATVFTLPLSLIFERSIHYPVASFVTTLTTTLFDVLYPGY